MSDAPTVVEQPKTPFTLVVNGVSFRAVDFLNEMTVRQTEEVTKLIGGLFPALMSITAKSADGGLEAELPRMIGGLVQAIGAGDLRRLLAMFIRRVDGVPSTIDERMEAALDLTNGQAMELLVNFFVSIGR
jgi:hypothetical protein